jgi:hypothetical protein
MKRDVVFAALLREPDLLEGAGGIERVGVQRAGGQARRGACHQYLRLEVEPALLANVVGENETSADLVGVITSRSAAGKQSHD